MPHAPTPPLVSVVIPTYNRSAVLCNCVDSLLAGTFRNLEIIIVDNASTDNTPALVRSRYLPSCPNVYYLRSPTNLMASGGRNAGIRLARGQWILCLDNDNLPLPDMIQQLLACAAAHPELGLIGALSYNVFNHSVWTLGGHINWWTGRAADHHKCLFHHKHFPLETLDAAGFDDCYPTTASCPNALFIRRSTIEKIGDFNPHYGACFEDPDFCLRASRAGIPAAICTRARTRHLCFVEHGESPLLRQLGISNPRSSFLMARNRIWFMKTFSPKYALPSFLLLFAPAFCLFYSLLALSQKNFPVASAFVRGTLAGLFRPPPHYPPPDWSLPPPPHTPPLASPNPTPHTPNT